MMLILLDGQDFDGFLADFSLTIANPEECFTVNITDDVILEITEVFSATIVPVGPLPQEATPGVVEAFVNIFDNDSEYCVILLSRVF